MADIAPIMVAVGAPVSPIKKMTKTAKKVKTTTNVVKKAKGLSSNHPQFIDMVTQAIHALKEHKGSSRQAVLKYIMANFNVGSDPKWVNARIKIALKRGVTTGIFKQSKGMGASGSFRIGEKKAVSVKKPKVAKTKKVTNETKSKVAKPSKANKTSPKKVKKVKTVTPAAVPSTARSKVATKAKSPKKTVAKKPKTVKKVKSPAKVKGGKKLTKKGAPSLAPIS